MSKLINK